MTRPLLIAAVILAIILVILHLAGAPVAAVAAAGAGALVAGGLALAGTDRAPVVVGGKDDSGVTFHGETVAPDFIPVLEKVTDGPQVLPRLLDDVPEGPEYQDQDLKVNPVLHFGQRKLLMSEVGFLTRYGHLSDEVVYAGAGPGTHIKYLAHLFPKHKFTLYDAARFALRGYPETDSRITVHNRYFTDQDARDLKGKKVLFISDIRTGADVTSARKRVPVDMDLQGGWVTLARPAASSLKFSLPWEEGKTKYFGGEIRLQAWAPKGTSETRLEFKGVPKKKDYDHGEYYRRLHYLSAGLRQWGFFRAPSQGLPEGVPGIDHCFSCTLEATAWQEYIETAHKETDAERPSVSDLMNGATRALGQNLNRPPHGVEPETPMVDKRETLIKNCQMGEYPCRPQEVSKMRKRKRYARQRRRIEALNNEKEDDPRPAGEA